MKILIAEDDLVTREIMKRLIGHLATEILEASNGIEALELIEREDPDFLITDLQMPILDGMAVVEAVRSSRRHSHLPVICMSSVKNREEITRLVALGIADYILKPLRSSDVHERLQRVLAEQSGWRQRAANGERSVLLLVGADDAVRHALVPLLEMDYTIVEAATGAQALRAYQTAATKPNLLLVTQGITSLREDQLAALISKLAVDAHVSIPAFWLLTRDTEVPAERMGAYAGVIRVCADGERLMDELRRTVLAETTSPAPLS